MKIELQCGDTITIPEGCKAVIKDGNVIFEKEEKVSNFNDGDILVTIADGKRRNAFIYKNTDNLGYHNYYIGVNTAKQLVINNDLNSRWGNRDLVYATKEEKQLLFDKMKEQGLLWNAKEKQVEKIRWQAKNGEYYYHINADGFVSAAKHTDYITDYYRYNFGNYFRTKEQTEEAAKRMQETLLNYHKELNCG